MEFAKSMKSALSPKYSSIDPCLDFSSYACDGWRQTHTIAPGNSGGLRVKISLHRDPLGDSLTYAMLVVTDMFSAMDETNENIMRNILDGDFVKETPWPHSDRAIARENFDKMKTSYASCMDEQAIKKAGVAPLRVLLDEFESLYPVKLGASGTGSRPSNQELTDLLIWLAQRTTPTLINSAVAVSRPVSFVDLPVLISTLFQA